jgi:hypothetical protein
MEITKDNFDLHEGQIISDIEGVISQNYIYHINIFSHIVGLHQP